MYVHVQSQYVTTSQSAGDERARRESPRRGSIFSARVYALPLNRRTASSCCSASSPCATSSRCTHDRAQRDTSSFPPVSSGPSSRLLHASLSLRSAASASADDGDEDERRSESRTAKSMKMLDRSIAKRSEVGLARADRSRSVTASQSLHASRETEKERERVTHQTRLVPRPRTSPSSARRLPPPPARPPCPRRASRQTRSRRSRARLGRRPA